MPNKPILALVVSDAGALQNGLLALMTTIPPIGTVLAAEDVNLALRMVETHQPALIILDMSSRQAQDVIHEIKTEWPHIHLIVLVADIAQQKQAIDLGADRVLVKGFPAPKLVALIEDLLSHS